MSHWTHPCCEGCFTHITNLPPGKAARLLQTEEETCCFCGVPTSEGIFIRHITMPEMFCEHE